MRRFNRPAFETGVGGAPCPENPPLPARLRERIANRCTVAAAWAVGLAVWAGVLIWMALAA